MDIGNILKKAWKTIWKNKILWLFGILAGCGASSTGSGGGSGNARMTFSNPTTVEGITETLADIPPIVWIVIGLTIIFVAIFLSILFFLAGVLGTSGVIAGAILADDEEPESAPLSFKSIFAIVKPHYWKVLGLNFGWWLISTIITVILLIPLFLFIVCSCGLGMFVLLLVTWFINLMIIFTSIAIIKEDRGIFDGIERAWKVITRNLPQVFLMFLILGFGQILISLVLTLPLFLVFIPLILNLIITGMESFTVGLIVSGVMFLIYVPLMVLLSGILKAYILTSWTLTYNRLVAEEGFEPDILTCHDDYPEDF